MEHAEAQKEFLTYYDSYGNAIFRYCLLRLRDKEKAHELVQESFMRLWQTIRNGEKITYPKALIYKIAFNLIVNYTARIKSVSLDQMYETDDFEPASDDHERFYENADGRRAAKALRLIDPIYRDAVYMRYIEGMSVKEIAVSIGVSQTVASVRIYRGLKKLKVLLTQ